MPVSKKRKKDGKPVQRKEGAAPGAAHPHGPDEKPETPGTPERRSGKPSNPFVAQQQGRRGAQRGH